MRSRLHRDRGVASVSLRQLLEALDCIGRILPVASGSARGSVFVVEAPAEDQSYADIASSLDDSFGVLVARIVEIEEVNGGRHAGQHRLGEGE